MANRVKGLGKAISRTHRFRPELLILMETAVRAGHAKDITALIEQSVILFLEKRGAALPMLAETADGDIEARVANVLAVASAKQRQRFIERLALSEYDVGLPTDRLGTPLPGLAVERH